MQTAGGNISRLVSGFPNFHFEEIDGTDPVASYAALQRAREYCRAGKGPAFVHAHVIRPYSHSLSDDERLYRPDSERQRDAARDPITRMQMFLLREGILDEKGINELEKEVEDEVQVAVDRALEALPPAPETIMNVRVLAGSRSDFGGVRDEPVHRAPTRRMAQEARRQDDGRSDQRYAARRDEAR